MLSHQDIRNLTSKEIDSRLFEIKDIELELFQLIETERKQGKTAYTTAKIHELSLQYISYLVC